MRRPLAAIFLLFLGAGASAAPVSFKRVWPEWEDAIDFQSYSEYRTGKEVVGKWTVLRSQPEHRSGLYFMTRVENHGPPVPGAAFVIRVISVGSVETRVYRFPADIPKKSWLFELGLTGRDWEGPKLQPIAWEVELDDAGGNILARETSYLWEKPEKR
ncbi:MAG TPA: hypothetical protein VGG34_11030 [Opitutaceae bacterium]|jgi:hypothetical protein